MMFNGVAFQYLDNPIQVDTDKEIRLFVLNVGPSIDSSFHIVGTIFDTVIKEGVVLNGEMRVTGAPRPSTSPPPRGDHRTLSCRGRPLSHRHPRLQLPRSRGTRSATSRRRRAVGWTGFAEP